MTKPNTLLSTISTIPDPTSGDDVFVNEVPFVPEEGVQSVFGGALVSQAINAASATLAPDFDVYSSQSTFLRPASFEENIIYRVERVADGRAYATRVVRAEQQGKSVYVAIIAFQRASINPGSVLSYHLPMPPMNDLRPDDVNESDFLKHMSAASPSLAKVHTDEPFEWRPASVEQGNDPTTYRARGFFRSRVSLPCDRITNMAALAYVSDKFLLGTALNANPEALGERMRNLSTAASLTHTLSFHDPDVRVDDWLVAERETSWAANGRVIIQQKIWHVASGRFILECMQEAITWLKPAKL